MVTIKDVAEAAGVSFKTVSRVINNDPNVSDTTRLRVQAVIQELGYRPNFAARHMRTQRSRVIGFLTDEIATTPFAVNIIKGAQYQAWQSGYLLLVVNTENDLSRAASAIEMMLERNVEGMIYATMRHLIVAPPANLYEAPAVLVNCRSADQSLPAVIPDESSGGFEATRALYQAGRRRIALINLEAEAPAARGRLEGYRQGLRAVGLPFRAEWVRSTDGQPGSGYRQAAELLSLNPMPDAFFCGNDRVAMGAYDAIKERGLRIPQDIAVIGFDNQDVIAANLRPSLTTMALPHYEMGRWAVEQLLQPSERQSHYEPHKLPCPLIERASVSSEKS